MADEMLFWTGLRFGELLALTFDDVDLDEKIISVNKSYQYLKDKEIITPPKSPKSNRKINTPAFLAQD